MSLCFNAAGGTSLLGSSLDTEAVNGPAANIQERRGGRNAISVCTGEVSADPGAALNRIIEQGFTKTVQDRPPTYLPTKAPRQPAR